MAKTVVSNKGEFQAGVSGFTHADIDISHPIAFKDSKLEFRLLNILTGMNDTGKSFIMKLIWAASCMFNQLLEKSNLGHVSTMNEDVECMQFILDNTFSNQDITGSFRCWIDIDNSTCMVELAVEAGKVQSVNAVYPPKTDFRAQAIFMSKETRTFNLLDQYTKVKKLLKVAEPLDEAAFIALLGHYKLYDIVAFEYVLTKLANITTLWPKISKRHAPMFQDVFKSLDITGLDFDSATQITYFTDKIKGRQPVSSLGIGTQSMLMMILISGI